LQHQKLVQNASKPEKEDLAEEMEREEIEGSYIHDVNFDKQIEHIKLMQADEAKLAIARTIKEKEAEE